MGQTGGDESAGAHPDTGVERGQVQALHRLIERGKRSELIGRAEQAAAGQGDTPAAHPAGGGPS